MKKKKTSNKINTDIVIYQGKNGGIEFKGDIKKETFWATQAQIAELFGIDRTVATKHINKVIGDDEVDEKSNVQKMHIANSDKPVNFYSLDIILGVGYRTNSKMAIVFRKWATKVLKSYVTDGFVVDKKKIEKNYKKFLETVEDIKKVLPEHYDSFNSENAIDLTKLFASTWLSLDAYDKGQLETKKVSKELVRLEVEELQKSIDEFKSVLKKRGEATDFFATDRHIESLHGIVGNIMQSIGGQSVYKSVEEKAAHLCC
jgi:hypothetical protein